MERNLIVLLAAAALTATPAMAQDDDFGVWSEVNVEKKIDSRWSVGAGAELRLRDDAGEWDRWSVGAEASYKITDWLKASAGYTLIDDHRYKLNNKGTKYADFWGVRHRVNVSLAASQSLGDLSVSLRERWQYTFRPEATATRYYVATGDEADEHVYACKAKNVWRNRLQLKYKVSKMWRPYVSAETYVAHGVDKVRYAAGTEVRLNKQHWLDVKYLYQHEYDNTDEEGNRHIIGIGYTYKF